MKQEIKITQNSNADMSIGVPKNLTAIEWFWNKIALKLSVEQINEFLPQLEQAKAMEKEQIVEARIDGDTWSTAIKEMRRAYAELYYNETYGGNK